MERDWAVVKWAYMPHATVFIKDVLRHHKVAIFPAAVVLLVIILSILGISGSSSGVYDAYLGASRSHFVLGEPRTVRSDEWLVNTPFTVAQYNNSFPTYSADIGNGQDMSVVIDVPYKDWSTVFRPQNWSFFVMPFEMAFAFKWWFLAALLAIAVYAFVLLLYPRKIVLAALVSAFFLFSPFIQWWYQSITILTVAYGLLLLTTGIRLLRAQSWRTAATYAVLAVFLSICFALIMYPAFQITVALVIIGAFFAILYGKRELHLLWKHQSLILLAAIVIVALAVIGLFVWQHFEAIRTTLGTVYPGSRNVQSGGVDPYVLITWPLSYLLLRGSTANAFQTNQSEASSFMFVGIVILPFLIYQYISRRSSFSRIEQGLLVGATAVSALFAVRMFLPFGGELFSLLGLSKVPHMRLLIGLGITNLIILLVALGRKPAPPSSWKTLFSSKQLIVTGMLFILYLGMVLLTVSHFAIPSIGLKKAALIALIFAIPSSLVLRDEMWWRYAGLSGLVIISLASSALANPLYTGVAVNNNPLVSYIQTTEKGDSLYWAANNSPILSSLLVASGAETYGGVNTYPQLSIWSSAFPGQETIFNRYAHIRFVFDSSVTQPYLELIQNDSFSIHVSPCDPFIAKLNVGYIVSESPVVGQCLMLTKDAPFDQKHLYIYKESR